ncbi:MAG: hypothetical protein Q7T26_11730 [Dehalococcoidia bacterium]|nr:hypothetical protein [Dehalococcoidia bacterium]
MPIDALKTALPLYLKVKDAEYYGKAIELRDAIKGWLNYIPQTFPHYTRHTVEHSGEIIAQLSKLLFKNERPDSPVIELSAIEAYILIAAAYLHDAGMVVSDSEKLSILASDEWKNWTTGDGSAAKRWTNIQLLRADKENASAGFLADVQVRFLIAEYIRRKHHERAAEVIFGLQSSLGRFAFDDPVLLRTVSDVCVSHGLRREQLEDNERYPERRDVRGETANVRLMAILLRIGDLLDMSYDRACPLLLNAACPLPAESLAHWSQYQRITHRLTSHDRIDITAECHQQEEHRTLQDWCQWLVEEANNANVLMARATRHGG